MTEGPDASSDPLDPTGRPVPPEPADPRDLPEPVEPLDPVGAQGREAVVTPAIAQGITAVRLAAAARRPRLRIAVGAYLVLLVVIGLLVNHHWWAPVLWLLAGSLVGLWVMTRASRKALQALYPKDTSVRVATGTDGLRFTVPKGSYLLPWADVRSAEVVRDHLVLRRSGPGGAIIVPPALFGPDTVEAAEAAAQHNAGPPSP